MGAGAGVVACRREAVQAAVDKAADLGELCQAVTTPCIVHSDGSIIPIDSIPFGFHVISTDSTTTFRVSSTWNRDMLSRM